MDVAAVITRMRANADVFAALCRDVDTKQARWKPEPKRWSILEVVAHLADEEVEDFRARLDVVLHRPADPWPGIDPEGWPLSRRYNEGDLPTALARFLAARSASIAWLESLDAPDWTTESTHPRGFTLRAGDLLTSWLAHDIIHIRQIDRLHRAWLVDVLSDYSAEYAGPW